MFPTTYRETWREYVWYCLLFGTVGSALIGGQFFEGVFAVGMCIMGLLLVGWVIYVVLRFVMYHLSGGVD